MRRRRYKLVIRLGARVEKARFATLDEALDALAERIPHVSPRDGRSALGRDYEPVKQVAGRLEVHGPEGRHGGIDVRGDGSAEPYLGWIRKELIAPAPDETAVDALRRVLATF